MAQPNARCAARAARRYLPHQLGAALELLAELAREGADLGALSRRYQHVVAQDYFGTELGQQVRAALSSARGGPA